MPIPGIDLTDLALYDRANNSSAGIRNPDGSKTLIYAPDRRNVKTGYWRVEELYRASINFVPQTIAALELTGAESIAIIGAGYGWGAEALKAALPGLTIAAVDTGGFVQDTKNVTETADIQAKMTDFGLNILMPEWSAMLGEYDDGGTKSRITIESSDISKSGDIDNLRRDYHGGSNIKFDWAISEQVLPWITDAEAVTLDADMVSLATNVAHYTSTYESKNDFITTITNITNTNPCVIAAPNHGINPRRIIDRVTGTARVYLSGIEGMTEINGLDAEILNADIPRGGILDPDELILDIDATKFSTYTGAGIIHGYEREPWNWKHLSVENTVRAQLTDQPWYTVSDWKSLLPGSLIYNAQGGVS
jgi:hypothetical protein